MMCRVYVVMVRQRWEPNASDAAELSIEPMPNIVEIASDRQFEVRKITKQEFEAVWPAN